MKKRNLSGIYRILIVAVPLVVIVGILYVKVLQLQAHSSRGTHLLINEVVADNLSTLKDENGVYADWIELYNPTEQEINLKGYYLSDTSNELTKWAFPDICIDSNGYLIVFCDGNLEEDTLHANFLINADKETIYLSDENENVIDSIRLENQQCDISYGRIFGNVGETGFLPYSTPLESNPVYFTQNSEPEADWGEVRFSLEGGCYDGNIQVELSCDVEGAVILYTLDGSEPDISSYVYKKPIKITNERRPNQYTTKKCVLYPSSNAYNADTRYGVNEVYKATVIRARILKDAKLSTGIDTNTYFINSDYSLPLVSLTTDPDGLFDDVNGAYVLGYNYYTTRKYGKKLTYTNSNSAGDLTGHIEIYDTDGSVFKDDMIFSMAGNTSAAQNVQKSFNVTLNNKKITGDMFSGAGSIEYEWFSLRGTGCSEVKTNLYYTYPSAFISNFISEENVGGQRSRFCILFIDGEYWGLYSLMEPKGKEYISKNTRISKKDIILVEPWISPWNKEFEDFFYEIKQRDFNKKTDYEWISTKIDMENFMSFVLAETFFCNTDAFVKGTGNLYIWKEKGGLWKWELYDFDSTMIDDENYLRRVLDCTFDDEMEEKQNFSAWLFQRLWRCEEFRSDFALYVRLQCNELYRKENVLSAFEEHVNLYASEMPENLLRCEKGYTKLQKLNYRLRGKSTEYENCTMDDWEVMIDNVYQFLSNRTECVLGFLEELKV